MRTGGVGGHADGCCAQALFEGTHDSQLGPTGCGLDCTSADDVAAVQSLFRSLKVGHECVNVADGHVVDVDEAARGDTCTGDYEDESGNTASCETAFANAPNTMISSCPHGCTYKRTVWKQAAKSFGRNGDADPGCMLPFAFLTSVAEKSSCPIGYDLDNGNCVWDGEFCAEHTITNNGDGTYTHDYSLPTGKVCQSCWNGYTSDGQYVCPCSLSCTL